MSQPKPFAEYRDTPLWHALAAAVAELEASKEIAVATAPAYVVGYLCQQLVARGVTTSEALRDEP